MRAVLLALMILLPAMASATDVPGGTLSAHTVWKKSGSPYVLRGDVTVAWGVRLTIEPGVQVVAAPTDALKSGVDPERVELIVDGTLWVRGTAARPVELTSHGGSGSWYGIRVRGGRGTVIDHALITQARQGISLGMSAAVKNTSVSASAEDCVHVSWGIAKLEGNTLSGGCERRPPDLREPALRMASLRMASLQRPPTSEPSVRGRRVFLMTGPSLRGGALAASSPRRREELHSSPAPLEPHPVVARAAASRPADKAVEALRRSSRSRPVPPRAEHETPLLAEAFRALLAPNITAPALFLYSGTGGSAPPLHSGRGGSAEGPPPGVECAHEPRALESPECPGLRRGRLDPERLRVASGRAEARSPSPHGLEPDRSSANTDPSGARGLLPSPGDSKLALAAPAQAAHP